jgi:hypothetical protein
MRTVQQTKLLIFLCDRLAKPKVWSSRNKGKYRQIFSLNNSSKFATILKNLVKECMMRSKMCDKHRKREKPTLMTEQSPRLMAELMA